MSDETKNEGLEPQPFDLQPTLFVSFPPFQSIEGVADSGVRLPEQMGLKFLLLRSLWETHFSVLAWVDVWIHGVQHAGHPGHGAQVHSFSVKRTVSSWSVFLNNRNVTVHIVILILVCHCLSSVGQNHLFHPFSICSLF